MYNLNKSKKSLASQQITQKQEEKYFTSTLDSAFLTFQSSQHHPGGFQAEVVPQGIQNTLCPPRNSQTKTLHSLSPKINTLKEHPVITWS